MEGTLRSARAPFVGRSFGPGWASALLERATDAPVPEGLDDSDDLIRRAAQPLSFRGERSSHGVRLVLSTTARPTVALLGAWS